MISVDVRDLCVVVLTFNEEKHIGRMLASVIDVCGKVVVVDSGSTDRTVEIARDFGALVFENPWRNYSTQFNWALDHVPTEFNWILRLDADEVVTSLLRDEIVLRLPTLSADVSGVMVGRRMCFMGRPIRHGGVFPVRVLRIFRRLRGRCEDRWMDEHIIVEGAVAEFRGEIVDNNLNSLTWWIGKHNSYASREVIDLLNLEFMFMKHETVADLRSGQQVGVKRWLKERVYAVMPVGIRALIYFIYRFVFRFGFLDGREGAAFHVLQGFWYRYLVDMKLHEVKLYMRRNNVDAVTAIKDTLGINISS
jgi:glycosyltransferase involved in cell wall biosynthesis